MAVGTAWRSSAAEGTAAGARSKPAFPRLIYLLVKDVRWRQKSHSRIVVAERGEHAAGVAVGVGALAKCGAQQVKAVGLMAVFAFAFT